MQAALRQRQDWRDGEPGWRAVVLHHLGRLVGVVLVVGLVVLGMAVLWPEIRQQKIQDDEVAQLEAARDATAAERDRLQAQLEWIREDEEFVELQARDTLNLYREGETIIRIDRGSEEGGRP